MINLILTLLRKMSRIYDSDLQINTALSLSSAHINVLLSHCPRESPINFYRFCIASRLFLAGTFHIFGFIDFI